MDVFGNDSDDSGSEEGFRINKNFAERYDKWRQKEELQKLKDKYGDVENSDDDDESSSESEDEDAEALTTKLDTDWLKTLAALKRKDPKIYDKSAKFYEEGSYSGESEEQISSKQKSTKKDKPYLLKDYERDLIVKKGGQLSDSEGDEDEDGRHLPRSYYEEQEEIKQSLRAVIGGAEDEDGSGEEELFTKRKVSKEDEDKEEKEYEDWLKKQAAEKKKLAGVDPWDKPNLDEGEEFLRDYILNKRYMDDNQEDRVPTYDEIVNVEEEEEDLEKQETFERKFNFRYEEPDPEFIKSYPRTIGESVRRKNERRARKRQLAKEKRQQEKDKKREELKQLKNLKKREIMDKIELIKEVTGNNEIGFSADDIEEDFDPAKYDHMMQKAFSDDYYEGDVEEAKPVFDDDEEMGLDAENWDEYVPDENGEAYQGADDQQNDAEEEYEEDAEEWGADVAMGSKRQQRRKSKFAKAVARRKPVFDPDDKTFEEYLDEYYKLDYEDMIGDQPCRFKYRSVVANDFGLSTNEVLAAKEKELNQWVSVKKMSQYRTKEEELIDVKVFQKKSKRKANVLMSVFDTEKSSASEGKKGTENTDQGKGKTPKSKKRKIESKSEGMQDRGFVKKTELSPDFAQNGSNANSQQQGTSKRKRKRKGKGKPGKNAISDERLKAYGINPKKFKYMKKTSS